MVSRERPPARAASTNSVLITCSVPDRAIRANDGIVAMPIATIAVSVSAPNTAPNMIASSSAGNASTRSLTRMTNSPSHRGDIPARMPSGVPMTAAIPTATTPTYNVVRAPTMIWLSRSRPNLSVPNKCDAPKPEQPVGGVDLHRVERRPEERQHRGQHDQADEHRRPRTRLRITNLAIAGRARCRGRRRRS